MNNETKQPTNAEIRERLARALEGLRRGRADKWPYSDPNPQSGAQRET